MEERLTFNDGTGIRQVEGPEPPPALAWAGPGTAARADARHAEAALVEPRRVDWAWRGLLFFTFVLFFRPQDTFPILSPLHLAEMSAIFALTAMGIQRLQRGESLVPITPEFLGVAALGALMAATIPFSIWMGGAFATFSDVYLKIIAIFILMMHALRSPKRIERMTWIILLACGYLGFRAMLDYVRGVNLIEGGRVQGAIGGIFRNPNDLALNLVSYLPLAVVFALMPGRPLRRVAGGAIAMLMIGAVIATQSRSGTVGLAIVLLICAGYALRRRPALVLAGVLAIGLAVPFLPQSYYERMASITDESKDATGSREARKTLMREAVDAFLTHPFTGVGAGQFKNYNPPDRQETWRETHNAVLQLAAELGLLGPIILFFLLGQGMLATRQARRMLTRGVAEGRLSARDPSVVWMHAHLSAIGVGLVGWFICAMFASVAYNWTFYYLLALAATPRELLLASGFGDLRRVRRASRARAGAPLPAPREAGV